MNCKYKTKDIKVNSWGNCEQLFCKKHDQFLTGLTCDGCPDYQEKDPLIWLMIGVVIFMLFLILPPMVSGCIGYFDNEQTMGDY